MPQQHGGGHRQTFWFFSVSCIILPLQDKQRIRKTQTQSLPKMCDQSPAKNVWPTPVLESLAQEKILVIKLKKK